MDVDILSVNMSIYTRTGDDGTTALFGGKRLLKSDLQIEAYGGLDELSAYLGLLISKTKNKDDKELFTFIQKDLYQMMGYLAGAKINLDYLAKEIIKFEKIIDTLELKLPKLTQFILPQGTELSVHAHIARTICRRAERSVVRYDNALKIVIRYLNRLSDLLFMFARTYNTNEVVV